MARPVQANGRKQSAATHRRESERSATHTQTDHGTLSTHPVVEGMHARVTAAGVVCREQWRREHAAWSRSWAGCCQNYRNCPIDSKHNAPNLTHKRARPHKQLTATDAGDKNNHDLLTRSATPAGHCQLRSHALLPSLSKRLWERGRSENADACESCLQRRVQAEKPWAARSFRHLRFDEWGWMNVLYAPLHTCHVRPPAWTWAIEPSVTLPRPEPPASNCSQSVPAQHHPVRTSPN